MVKKLTLLTVSALMALGTLSHAHASGTMATIKEKLRKRQLEKDEEKACRDKAGGNNEKANVCLDLLKSSGNSSKYHGFLTIYYWNFCSKKNFYKQNSDSNRCEEVKAYIKKFNQEENHKSKDGIPLTIGVDGEDQKNIGYNP